MKLRVSDRHILLRAILTAVFFVIAVVSFTVGVVNIGKKTSGYQLIEAKVDKEALTYNNAVHYKYWFEGSSNRIKREIRTLEGIYTPILSAAYKQLDHQNIYTGQVGIANINQSQGQEVKVSPELYGILQDAYEKTLERKGFNMFAGALYAEWRSILILADPAPFDPALNQDQMDRLHRIAAVVNDLDNFKLEFLPNCVVRFTVSEAYTAFCGENEIYAPVLDLNVLRDAYRLRMMGNALEGSGYSLGYLFTPEGLVLNTSPRGSLNYDFYTLDDESYASIGLDGVFSGTTVTAFGMGSDYGYSIESDGRAIHRSEHFNVETGDFPDLILTLSVIGPDKDIVDTVYTAIRLFNLKTESEVSKMAAELEGRGFVVSYILQSALQ